jgi:hypothetical protein
MLLWILSVIDILAGISMALPNFLGFYLGIIELLKGGSSLLGGFENKGFALLGIMDMIAGILLVTGFSLPFFWALFVVKGAFTAIFSMGN